MACSPVADSWRLECGAVCHPCAFGLTVCFRSLQPALPPSLSEGVWNGIHWEQSSIFLSVWGSPSLLTDTVNGVHAPRLLSVLRSCAGVTRADVAAPSPADASRLPERSSARPPSPWMIPRGLERRVTVRLAAFPSRHAPKAPASFCGVVARLFL